MDENHMYRLETIIEKLVRCTSVACDIEAMKQANREREANALASAYNDNDFFNLKSSLYM
jgi:hypothetical protein